MGRSELQSTCIMRGEKQYTCEIEICYRIHMYAHEESQTF